MRYINIFLLIIFTSITTWAQDIDSQTRDISLKILNKKGRPVKNIAVRCIDSNNPGITDRNGLYIFKDMTDDYKIAILLPKYGETIIPVAGMDSIVVTLRSASLYSYANNEGQSMIIKKDPFQGNELMDVPALLNQCNCNSLLELLNGRITGLNLWSGAPEAGNSNPVNAVIRGTGTLKGSSEPLVVVDGIPYGTINEANSTLSVYDIQTIEVQKNASEWGVRGANGVILITTK